MAQLILSGYLSGCTNSGAAFIWLSKYTLVVLMHFALWLGPVVNAEIIWRKSEFLLVWVDCAPPSPQPKGNRTRSGEQNKKELAIQIDTSPQGITLTPHCHAAAT